MRYRPARAILLALPLAATLLLSVGCSSNSELRASSADGTAVLVPVVQTSIFRATDENTADIFLTDLPLSRLANPNDDLRDAAGNLIHIRLFLVPSPGKTPIDPTACNVAVYHFVFANGAIGIYGGGGYMSVSNKPQNPSISATLQDVNLRLIRATPDFADRLGAANLTGYVSASRDEPASNALQARAVRLLAGLPHRGQVPEKVAAPAAPPASPPPPPAPAPTPAR